MNHHSNSKKESEKLTATEKLANAPTIREGSKLRIPLLIQIPNKAEPKQLKRLDKAVEKPNKRINTEFSKKAQMSTKQANNRSDYAELPSLAEIMESGRSTTRIETPEPSEDNDFAKSTLQMNANMEMQQQAMDRTGFQLDDGSESNASPGLRGHSPVSPARWTRASPQALARLFEEGRNGDGLLRDLVKEVKAMHRESLRAATKCVSPWQGPRPRPQPIITIQPKVKAEAFSLDRC